MNQEDSKTNKPKKKRTYNVEQYKKRMIANCKAKARRDGIAFDSSLTYLNLSAGKCPLLGIRLRYSTGPIADNTPVIYRLNNSIGYTESNIIVISYAAHRLVSKYTADELRSVADALLELNPTG